MTLERYRTVSAVETRQLGESLGRELRSGDIVLLYGDLGTGKTTLAQGIALGLGTPPKHYVRSPSFTLINEYRTSSGLPIHHIDLYRLDSASAIADLGLEEYLFANGISIVEWAEKLLPPASPTGETTAGFRIAERIEITFDSGDSENQRIIQITFTSPARTAPDFPLQPRPDVA